MQSVHVFVFVSRGSARAEKTAWRPAVPLLNLCELFLSGRCGIADAAGGRALLPQQ